MGVFINKQHIPYTINPGDRVAQLIVEKRLSVDLIKVSKVDETARGEGGFGSTGIQ